jgi:hypothetical protein
MQVLGAELRNGYQNEGAFGPLQVIREMDAASRGSASGFETSMLGTNLNGRSRGWKPNPDKNKDKDGKVRQVPEPGSLLLILSGAAAVAAVRSRRKRLR